MDFKKILGFLLVGVAVLQWAAASLQNFPTHVFQKNTGRRGSTIPEPEQLEQPLQNNE